MRLLCACVLLILLAFPLAAADITGKWTGSVEFKTSDGTADGGSAYAEFKQKGQEITGFAGQDESNKGPIENGKLDGKKLTLQVTLTGDGGKTVYKVTLTLVNDNRMEGDVEGQRDDGGKMAGKIVLTRQTS